MASLKEVAVPDIGDFEDVPIVELLVAVGDTVAAEDPLVALESDKATMEVPSPFAGTVKELRVALGDNVSEGAILLVLETADDAAPAGGEEAGGSPSEAASATAIESSISAEAESETAATSGAELPAPAGPAGNAGAGGNPEAPASDGAGAGQAGYGSSADEGGVGGGGQTPSRHDVYASPSVRRAARQQGIDLARVEGTGRKGRITLEDLARPLREEAPAPAAAAAPAKSADGDGGLGLAPWPKVDFEKFGPVERVALTRINKLAGANLARNWVRIPHVTHHDEADVTDLEAFRKQLNAEQKDVKVTMVALLLKACAALLKTDFPRFNASLDGEELVLRRYYHLGFAADTPNGLVVPVIRDVDQKGLLQLATELTELSAKARAGKLSPTEMSGATFTISSLGGIGGTAFTPIINAPEVAILGVVRSQIKPVWTGTEFVPRLMVPLSLSYDHRVIDGAAAARFVAQLSKTLTDLRRVLL